MSCNNTTYLLLINASVELQREFHKYSFFTRMLEYNTPTAMLINKTVTPIWIVIGTFGNIISALVWANPRMRTCNTAAYYLTCLAIADFTFLLIHLVYELQMPWQLGTLDVIGWCQIFSVINLSVQYFCVFLVFAFTIERFLSVCHPFKSERFGKTRTPRIIAYLLILCILIGLPQAYFWDINHVGECQVRPKVNTMTSLSFYSIYTWTTELAIFGVLPLCVLFLNTAVVIKIRNVGKLNLGKVKFKSRSGDGLLNNSPKNDNNTSKTRHNLDPTISRKPTVSRKDCETLLNGQSGTHSVRSTAGGGGSGGTAGSNAGHRGTTITLLWVSFFLIATMLPNTIVYALQHRVRFGPMPCPIENMGDDPQWQTFFKFQTVKTIIKEISLSHHVGNIFIYMATSGRFLQLAFKSLKYRNKPCSKDSKDTSLHTIRSQHVRAEGDAL